jgi:hypothetical protein
MTTTSTKFASAFFTAQVIRKEHGRLVNKSTLATPALSMRNEQMIEREDNRDAVEREENIDQLRYMVRACNYDDTVLLANVKSRRRLYAPPTGYVAVMHEDTTFRKDMFDRHLFRGISIVNIKRTLKYSEAHMKQCLTRLNQCIRDASTTPASTQAKHAWVASLGPFAWLGIYEVHSHETSRPYTYAAIVVAGLDDKTYEEMYDLCCCMHGKKSIAEAMKLLQPYKDMAIKTRRRLLATMLACLAEEATTASMCPPDEAYARTQISPAGVAKQVWDWLPPLPYRVPVGFILPDVIPRDCPPLPEFASYLVGANMTQAELEERGELYPREILPDTEVVLDDCVPKLNPLLLSDEMTTTKKGSSTKKNSGKTEPHYIRYAASNDMTRHGKWVLRGPLDPIRVSTLAVDSVLPTLYSIQFYAYPNQYYASSSQEDRGCIFKKSTDVFFTWEDASLAGNRLVSCGYDNEKESVEVNKTTEQVAGTWNTTTYLPLFVRVSCKDEMGLTKEELDTTKRMSGWLT